MILPWKLSPGCPFGVLLISLTLFTNLIANAVPEKTVGMKAKVVIVGAGVSGIAAANKLLQDGLTDVIVLEAQDRIGGRLYYKEIGEKYGGVDLGGHWVHGQEGNIIYDIAHPLGLVHHSGDYSKWMLFRQDGSQLDYMTPRFCLFNHIFEEVEKANKLNRTEPVAKTYAEVANNAVEICRNGSNFSNDDLKALQIFTRQILCVLEACEDIADVSVKTSSDYREPPGDKLIQWKQGGMNNIINLLMGVHEKSPWKGLGVDTKVKLSSRVAKIDWSSPDQVTVTTDSGSTETADFVIFTPSLNVLKKKHSSIFLPPLPKAKVDAIEALGMDVVAKVYLVYDEPWWPQGGITFPFLRTKEYTAQSQDLGDGIIELSTENHNPHVINAWFVGRAAKKMESLTEEEVKAAVMKTIRQFLGKKFTVTEPAMIVRSKWWSTEDFGGSYSYNSVAAEHLDNPRGSLAQPLLNKDGKPMVLFAGEATNRFKYSTAHGALESGWREADRIIKYLKAHSN